MATGLHPPRMATRSLCRLTSVTAHPHTLAEPCTAAVMLAADLDDTSLLFGPVITSSGISWVNRPYARVTLHGGVMFAAYLAWAYTPAPVLHSRV